MLLKVGSELLFGSACCGAGWANAFAPAGGAVQPFKRAVFLKAVVCPWCVKMAALLWTGDSLNMVHAWAVRDAGRLSTHCVYCSRDQGYMMWRGNLSRASCSHLYGCILAMCALEALAGLGGLLCPFMCFHRLCA